MCLHTLFACVCSKVLNVVRVWATTCLICLPVEMAECDGLQLFSAYFHVVWFEAK
jgi:hypothetical protein